MNVRFHPIPKTQLTFVNVALVPARTRSGETRYLCATWDGAFYVFDRAGREHVVPLPEGTNGTYSFAPDVEPGFAWVLFTGGKIARVDVDTGEIVFLEDVPLKVINWGATMTADGLFVAAATPGDVMVYDTRRREVKHMITPISSVNHYGKYLQAAPDGGVIVPIIVPGGELIRLDPQTGEFTSADVTEHVTGRNFLPPSVTLLSDGRYALPRPDSVALFSYPGFEWLGTLAYPDDNGDWQSFRNEADGRLFAYRAEEEPLYVLGEEGRWEVYLKRFPLSRGRSRLGAMFAALPENHLLWLSLFGELVEYDPDGTPRLVAELDNYGEQRISALAPSDGDRVFTTTFINASFQEMDLNTGQGRNVRPCQKHGGQASEALWFQGKFWLGCYGGAEITVYEPDAGGEWPENPRPFVDIGHEQMRPVGLCADERYLWCATHAQYGKYGGALARIDPATGACKVWRNLLPDHNPTGMVLDLPRRRIYGGTSVWPDCGSAPAAEGPAGVYAFDTEAEAVVWTARPVEDAEAVEVLCIHRDLVIAATGNQVILLRAEDGALAGSHVADPPLGRRTNTLFVGGDGELYLASAEGLFRYDLEGVRGERLIEGPVQKPEARGEDLFFIRDYRVGIAEGLWRS